MTRNLHNHRLCIIHLWFSPRSKIDLDKLNKFLHKRWWCKQSSLATTDILCSTTSQLQSHQYDQETLSSSHSLLSSLLCSLNRGSSQKILTQFSWEISSKRVWGRAWLTSIATRSNLRTSLTFKLHAFPHHKVKSTIVQWDSIPIRCSAL